MLNLEPKHLNEVKQILQQHLPNATIWAFGSRVVGNARKYSDLDLAILNHPALNLLQLANLKEAFSESNLPFRVDIVEWGQLDNNFQKIIKQQYEVVQ